MKIGINGYEAVVPRFGYDQKTGLPRRVGSGEYCYRLLLNLNRIDKKNDYTIYLPTFPSPDFPPESENWHYKIIGKKTIWTLFDLSFYFFKKREKPDVFFSPTHYLPLFTPFPCAISILDLSYLKYPLLFKKRDLYQLKIWSKFSINKSKRVFTISNSSRNDIIKTYQLPEEKVVVTYPGIKSVSSIKPFGPELRVEGYKALSMDKITKRYGIDGEYVLFVGTLQPRKNIGKLIEAFSKVLTLNSQLSRLAAKRATLSLAIVGKKGWQYEEILDAPKKFGVEGRVKFLENVTDEDLPTFYKNALCFVLPSLYEGFGLPILEAMQNGCPVITSNVSSLPEAGGDAAIYINPQDVDDIAQKLEKVIKDDKLRKEMIKKGYEQVKKFSWEKTAKETLRALEEIYEG
ncbi:MAG: glycosyltransferase family 1 protein [Candidatus Levybacteria bacterium]|nr:glycosyltransferase family 1 protein [Candidatus Levybacteria bacterium]